MRLKLLLVCCLLQVMLVWVLPCRAGQVFYIKEEKPAYPDLLPFLELLEDSAHQLTIQQLLAGSAPAFAPAAGFKLPLNPGSTYWGRITFYNALDKEMEWIFQIGNRYLNFVEVYIPGENGKLEVKESGEYVPLSRKDLKEDRNTTKISLLLPVGKALSVYIKIRNIDKKAPVVKPMLQTPELYYENIKRRNFFQGLFQGALVILILYHLMGFVGNRDMAYFFYIGYLVASATYFLNYYGFTTEFFITEQPVYYIEFYLFSTSLIPLFYLQFVRIFLNTAVKKTSTDRFIRAWMLLRFTEMMSMYLIHLLWFDFETVHFVHRQFAMAEAAFFAGILWWLYDRNDKSSIFVVIGTMCMPVGLVSSLVLSSVFNMVTVGNIFFEFSALTEIMMFSLGLGYRARRSEMEKRSAQEQIIRMQREANEQLENKVRERTFALQEANEELKTSQEELTQQAEELISINQHLGDTQRKLEVTYSELRKKSQDVMASITYASRIQEALLPFHNRIQKELPEFFILYKPRDIVSGDFYWFENITAHSLPGQSEGEGKCILAVGDSTGHGVPGAFMSMLGSSGLSDAVFQRGITDADEILNSLHRYIRNVLKQEQTDNRDGMDVGLCVIDKANRTMQYAGAMNPLYYVQQGEFREIKADKMPIGGRQAEAQRSFTRHEINIAVPTTFYLCSDGYQDQFGGPEQRKFMVGRLKRLLFDIHHKPMGEQKQILEQTLQEWMAQGPSAQIDDILVIGVRL